jgi:hypothetical protein
MTGAGSLLWIIAIGVLVYFVMRKGGGCCGSTHDQNHDHETNKEQPRGGCCG